MNSSSTLKNYNRKSASNVTKLLERTITVDTLSKKEILPFVRKEMPLKKKSTDMLHDLHDEQAKDARRKILGGDISNKIDQILKKFPAGKLQSKSNKKGSFFTIDELVPAFYADCHQHTRGQRRMPVPLPPIRSVL